MRILFAGYASVHFRCFAPLYQRLRGWPGVQVCFSGGLRSKTETGYDYDAGALYDGLDVDPGSVLSVEEIRDLDFDVHFSAHTKPILPRRADLRIQIFHGISFRNKSVRPENMGYDHYFLVGPYMLSRFAEAGLMSEDDPRVARIGFMKTDPLLDGSLDRASLLRGFGFSGERPVLLYAPTGAKRNSMETMGEPVIRELIAAGRYDVLIKPHDHPKNRQVDWSTYLRRYEDEHCRIVPPAQDVIPPLYLADLLVSDASSVVNEYALLDRPILFLDTPKLLRKAQTAPNSMLDLRTWGRRGGTVVGDPSEVVAAVDHSLAHPAQQSEVRREMARALFYNPGRATEAAMAWLADQILPPWSAKPRPAESHLADPGPARS